MNWFWSTQITICISEQLARNATLKLGLGFYEPFQTALWNPCKCKHFWQTPRTDFFSFGFILCCMYFDGSKSETYLNFPCYRDEVETSQAISGTWQAEWEASGEPFFPRSFWDTSIPSSAKTILTVETNQSLPFGWKACSVVLLSLPCLQSCSSDGKRKMSSGGSSWHDGRRREGGCGGTARLPEPGSSQMNDAWRKKETLSEAIFLEG